MICCNKTSIMAVMEHFLHFLGHLWGIILRKVSKSSENSWEPERLLCLNGLMTLFIVMKGQVIEAIHFDGGHCLCALVEWLVNICSFKWWIYLDHNRTIKRWIGRSCWNLFFFIKEKAISSLSSSLDLFNL